MSDPVPLPAPLACNAHGAIALRSPDEAEGGAAFVCGHVLELEVLDVRTGRALNHGAHLKRVVVKGGGQDVTYELAAPCYRYGVTGTFKNSLKASFYRYVSGMLKLLNYWGGDVGDGYSDDLGKAMRRFHADATETTVESINTIASEIHDLLREAGQGVASAGGTGRVALDLPPAPPGTTLDVTVEFHDVKYLAQEDVDAVAKEAWGMPNPDLRVRPCDVAEKPEIYYDRAAAKWPSGGDDPDDPAKESEIERSNWRLRAGTSNPRFRNFHTFKVSIDSMRTVFKDSVHVLTWCQPSWHETRMFKRSGRELDSGEFKGPPVDGTATATNTLSITQGGSEYDYAIFGLFRGSQGYRRLHIGIDLAGNSEETGGRLRTPVFAMNGGHVLRSGSKPIVAHARGRFSRYTHIDTANHIAKEGQYAKAGSLIGKMARHGFPSSQWPTHTHFETLSAESTGWTIYSSPNATDALSDGWNKIKDYPQHKSVKEPGKTPKYVKMQYGKYCLDPSETIKEWADDQLGAVYAEHLEYVMPGSYPGMMVPPCVQEYGAAGADGRMTVGGASRYPASDCACAIASADARTKEASQAYAPTCYALRTSLVPGECCCPVLADGGVKATLTIEQQVQYRLWQRGHFGTGLSGKKSDGTYEKLDGGLGATSHAYVEGALSTLYARPDDGQTAATSEFNDLVSDQALAIATEAGRSSATTDDRLAALAELLKNAANVEMLVSELEASTPSARL